MAEFPATPQNRCRMEYCLEKLKKNIDDYLDEKSSKEELGNWGKKAYYDLLKGGYTKIDKIVIYPFLKIISQINLEEDELNDIYPSTTEDIKEIRSIISGDKMYCFQVVGSIPEIIYKNYDQIFFDINKYKKFRLIKLEVEHYIKNKKISNEMFDYIKEIEEMQNFNVTILDLLQQKIVELCNVVFDVKKREMMPRFGLYSQSGDRNLGLIKLKEYLECYIGERNFVINISYIKGKNHLSILV